MQSGWPVPVTESGSSSHTIMIALDWQLLAMAGKADWMHVQRMASLLTQDHQAHVVLLL